MCRPENRSATNAIEICDLHDRVLFIDRIVGGSCAAIRVNVEIRVAARFPIAAIRRIVSGFDPIPLLQTKDPHARIGQTPGDSRTGGTGTDDEHIYHVMSAHGSCLAIITPEGCFLFDNIKQRPIALR